MEFRQRRSDAPEDFAAKHMTRSEINRSSKPPEPTSSQSFTQTETALLTISADFTIWLLISVGSRGPFWQNALGPKSAAKTKERSRRKSTEPSSLQKEMQSAAP